MNKLFSYNPTNKIKLVWKTLIVLFLSILLLAPTPAFALEYNSDTLKSYISNVKIQLDSVLASIKELPTLSYENGQNALTKIDSKLQEIQADAGKNAKDFRSFSNEAQKDYEEYLNSSKDIAKLGNFALHKLIKSSEVYPGISGKEDVEKVEKEYGHKIKYLFAHLITDENKALDRLGLALFYMACSQVARKSNKDGLKYEPSYKCQLVTEGYKVTQLPNLIVFNNKILQISDDIEKRVNLARQKAGNIKEYADVLLSFSDPDLLEEISELDKFIADLTKNLPNAS